MTVILCDYNQYGCRRNKKGVCYKIKNKLKIYRLAKNLTQAQLADKLKIHVVSYQRLEYGTRNPKLSTALDIAKILNTTVDELFGSPKRQLKSAKQKYKTK